MSLFDRTPLTEKDVASRHIDSSVAGERREETGSAVAQFLRSCRYSYESEAELQEGIAKALATEGFTFTREARLNSLSRIDFLSFDGGVGIEVKIGGSHADLVRQIFRYAGHDEIRELVVVTSRRHHSGIPPNVLGKPIHVVTLEVSAL